ncbi:MAG: type II toxin-antitoxin system VapC family toxin [Rhodomicrobium sp.]
MRILLDSVALVRWYRDPKKLSRPSYNAIFAENTEVFVSAATAWEIATKVRKGRLPEAARLIERFEDYLKDQEFTPLPVTMAHAKLGGSLSSAHKDPFDRLIAAQAQLEGLPVVTCDSAFQGLGVRILW